MRIPVLILCLTYILASAARCLAADSAIGSEVVVDAQSEKIINGALKFLASKQFPSGAWEQGSYPTAFTGYALMAFMSAGQLPNEGEYGKNVTRGMQYLLDHVGANGYISDGRTMRNRHEMDLRLDEAGDAGDASKNMYGHGIATIALAELYGQTRNPEIRPKLARAVKLIVNCQSNNGGWSYAPKVSGDADISQTVLQVVALRAAKNAGLDVPQETIDRAVGFVKSCYDAPSGGFTYQPHNHTPGFARTAAAIYSLQVCGRYDDPTIKTGSAYLFNSDDPTRKFYFDYGSFYAAPAQYMIGGETWRRWYGQMTLKLKQSAVMEPGGMYSWPKVTISPIYTTSVYVTVLAMPYHYIPLYQR